MLKAFVSTESTQGDAPGDFCFVPADELVGRHSFVCDSEKADGLGGCGCGRAFAGFTTLRGTSTARVAEVAMTEMEWRGRLFQSLCDNGWGSMMSAGDLAEWVDELVEDDLHTAAKLPVGLVIGRRAWNDAQGRTIDNLTYRGMVVVDASRHT
jgi:hypothetical protein